MSLTYNPAQVTVATSTFYATSDGAIQGFFQDDPAILYQLRSGLVAPTQTTPLWGGCGISVNLPTAGVESLAFKAVLSLATSAANLMGFTVWNKAHAMILNPSAQGGIPLAGAGSGTNPGGAINFFLLGSNAQIWVQVSSTVAAALKAGAYNQAVYWDYTNQVLLNAPGGTAIPVEVVDLVTNGNAQVVTSTSSATWNYAGYVALIKI